MLAAGLGLQAFFNRVAQILFEWDTFLGGRTLEDPYFLLWGFKFY